MPATASVPVKVPATQEPGTLIAGFVSGVLVGFDEGQPTVAFPANPTRAAMPARSMCVLSPENIGQDVVLLFEEGDPARPLIAGLMQQPQATSPAIVAATVDEETIEFTAARQIVLRCGDASLTLTKSGKILLRGNYVLSDSTGVNMIKGGIIRLN